MEMQDKPLRKLYTSLKSNNYDVPDNYESFERTLTESGQSGAQSRRALHESLKKNNYDVPDNYDSFYKSLFTPVNSTTSMAIGSEPVKPAPQKPTTSTTTGTPQHTVQPTKPAPAQPVRPQQVQKPQGKPMTAAQKAAAIGWAQGLTAQTKANTQRAMRKIKNIGKYQKAQGAYGQTKKGNIEYNPQTGKMEQTYLTPQGEQTIHKATADLASHEFRVQQGFLSRMSDNGLNPDNPEDVAKQHQLDKEHPIRDVLDSVWKEAEGIDKQAQEELRSKASSGFNLSTLAEASNSAGAPLAGHDRNFNDELSYQEKRHKAFDFDKMANTIYSRLPKDYRNDRLREYTAYFSKHPKEAKGKSAVAAAKDALMGQIYNNVYSHAVQERLPKSNLEFLLRKVADQPLISSKAAAEFAASSRTGSHGLEVAERDAMAQFGSQHKAMNIMGTVANMALDPITYVSGGVGGFVGKKALGVAGKAMLGKVAEKATEKAVGKVATDVASRYAAGTLAGRVVQGVAGGAANFATFNTLKGIEEQVATGGVVNPETGKSEGFSVGEILKSTGHGLLLGAATGTLSPIIGNFADKAVKATTSTVGKVALRAGETAVSTLAEGTVFSIPEWISGQGDAFDVWTDNMGMMLGFKASHAIKSAPRVLDALRTDGKRYGFSFKERLNKQMEASPSDAGFTSEELDELRNNGYMDLSMLFRNAQKQKSTSPKSHEVSKEVVDDYENLTPDTFDGYEAMKRLMNDKGVSEATRAKAYYILTGRMLPMSTIAGYTTDKTEDGDIVVKSMSAQGDVVTSRQFTNEKAAQGEIDKIMRQSELNSVDVGERYKETASNMLVVETAIKEVAPDADMETVLQNYRKVKSGQEDMPQELIDQAKSIDAAIERNRDIADANRPEAIRAKLNKETGLDVDATLRKMPKDRTEEEKELVDTYIKSLFPEQEKTEDGQTADVQADTEYKQRIEERQQAYDEGKEAFNVADTEGDNSDTDAIVLRYREAYDEIERVFADDAEMRIAQLEEDPWEVMNDQSLTPEQQDAVAYFVNSKAAMDGLTEAANENSENKRAEAEHKIAQRTNKQSGMIHPATLKVDDKQVYIVSGNVTMFPDGSTVDIHHSSESVVVCDAETGELRFISPEQIYKVDEPVDPSMELKAVDEAISAEQQSILGNEAETEVSETEEMSKQEENEQPQPIQQDNAVEEMNLDVQNEDEVNLPQDEDLQPSNETIEDDLPQQPETALQRIPKGENGEPLLEQTDPETAWDGVVEYMEDADDAQEYVESMVAQLTKDVDNAKKAVSKVKPSADMAKFKADKAAARQVQADAEARLDKWLQISNVNKARKQSELNRINAERAEADRIAREKAVAELAEQKRVEAEKKAEQEAIGAHAVNPKIKEKWDAAPKVVGNADIITLPDGSKLRGHYVLTEAGAATASHDVNNAYKPTEGFPIDENGQSVNDRDYERDEDARKISRSIADNYDSRALQSVTVVDNNGITLSGNGRNIAGELAAKQGTDGAYIDYLREFPQKYGLTAEQVQSMQHPRVHFVPDEVLPYDAATFARFNAQEMKSQSKPEAAVKLGKVVPDNIFGNIVRSLAQYDRLSDFYANEKDANGAIMELVKAGVVNDKQLPELRTGDALSAAGRELLENTLIGKVFQSNPDAVRQIIAQPGIKQSIVMALSEIAHNRTLANGYDLSEELSNAVDLVARAKQADPDTYKEGMPVSPFGRQQGLFDDELGDKRVTDATTLLLADILNSTKPSDLRKVLATYNAEGETAANGQLDIFSGDLRNKEEILTDINKHFINATAKEQQALVDAAIAERKRRAAEAAATEQSGGNDTAEQAASVETSSGQPQPVPVETTPIGTTSTPDEVQAQREQTETNPTEAQKEAGNYRKGHIKVDGYDIALENPKGSTRSGKDANGKEWSITMKHDYGYIRGTKGTDGDHIDVYLSDNPTAGNVYVVDQINQQTGDFDEHKVMYGFDSMDEAVQAYRDQYEDGWKVGNVTEVSREEFKKWVDSSARKTKPFAEYKSVRPEMGVGFDTEHAQSSDNYAHNSEKVHKAINAYEEAQEKFDNLFSLLVKEKESKPFDSREWREVNRTKEELKDVLLQLNTKELSELLKQVSEKDTEYVIKNVLDIVNREEHRLIAFNAILDKQGHITPEYKEEKKAIPVSEFVETDKKRAETHTMLTGIFHDKGYVVGTDAYLLLARKEDYDKSLEGKVTNKKGEVINGKYPNWRAVVNSGKQGKSWGVNLEELHAFTRGVLTKLKTEKANPSTKKDAKIAFKTADGKIVLCYANALDKALQGAKSIGAKSFFVNDDGFAITQTPKGYVICPMLNQDQNIDDNSFAYVPRVSELQHSTETLSNDTEAKRLATDTILSALNKAGIEVVRATDEQVQELFANTHATSLRTPQGTIYGWAVDGKIYLTEAGINPDTPIHEYTHLWAEAMKTKNKKGWNSIKALLKETPVWNEVVADPNYSNITNDEDAVASEVLSRISGRENAARMVAEAQKVIDEDKDVFEKAKSVTLLNRIKRALDMFWKWVGKELFKIKKFGSISEVTDRVLYDLMHSSKLNSNDKSLIGVHNISEQKLRKVLQQGGFANPSIAVIDTDKQVHNDYGEISLILPSRKINKSTGKNAGTFEGDAWTPMYPVVEKQISSDGGITMHNDINAVPKDMQSEVRNALNRWLENGSDTDLSYLYLFQQGKAPQMIVEKPKYSNEVHKTLNDIMFGVNSVYKLSKNEIKKLVELYIQTELDGNIKEYNEAIQRKISKYEELIKRGKPNSLRYRVADSYLEDIEKYGYPLSPLINFVNDVQRDKIKQGSKNAQKTLNTASQIIKDAGLEKDFKNWVEGLNNRYQTKEVIFDGFTPTGKRRYIPNTLENVSKIMKKQGRQASAGISISFSNFAAAVMKANGSLDNIRKKKSKLTNEHKDIEDFEEKWKEVYFDLAMKLQPNANMFDDYGFARLQEAANEKNPQTYIRNVYGITLSEEDVQKLQDLVKAIREERPALYFETKFERPVYLNEFSKAVVPEDFSDDLQNALRESGIEVFTYKRGDVEDRQRVTKQASYSSNDIAFQVINNSRDGNNTDRFTDGLNAVNEQFNRELAGLTEENADTKIFNLGSPSSILLSAGVEDKPMKLYGSKLMKKAKLHSFSPKELQNLPAAVAAPIAVFNNYKKTDNRSILTELKTKDGNFLVSLTIGKGIDVDFNIIASAFGKANDSIVKWINKGFATYINKEKALNYLYLSAPIAEAAENSELSSAAKIVKDFVNPVIKDENLLRDDTDTLSDIDSEENAPFANDAARSHAFDKEVNEQFNRELAELTEKNAQSKRLKLGQPSPMLSAAGVPDKPIILYGNKLLKKSKLHNFDVKELHNLPLAMQNPIAVFEGSHPNSFATLLEIKLGGYNTLASIEVNKKGEADFNIISSLFGKESKGVTKWILDGKLLSVDKEKAQSYISASALNADATYKNELSSAAKIVKDFVNPSIRGEKSSLQGKIDPQDTTPQAKALQAKMLSEKLNTPIRVVSDPEEIAELPSRRQQRAKGWWSAKNDEVVILLPNNADVADVANTVVHEVVGHKGLRKLIGEERFDEFLNEVYDHATNPIRTAIDEAERKLFDTEVDRLTQQKNAETDRPESRKGVFSRAEATVEANKKREQMRREATEEYMADMAGRIGDEGFEKMSAEELTFWGKIKAKVQKFLEKFLRGLKIAKSVKLTDKDVAYILYKSWKNLRNGGKPTVMDAAEDALMRNKTNYNETDISRFRDGDMGLDETITSMKAEISAANKDDFKAKVEAMKAIGGNLQKLRSAMARQRSYDISTAKAMTDLAQVLLDKGLLDNLSVYETKRVLSAVRNGVGKEDISGHVQKLMDIMVDNQLHSGANMLGKLFTMRGTRLNDRGIEVQGNLDPQGQILVKTARKYTSFPKEEIDNTLIPDLMSRMGSDDQTIADNAAIEYAGAQIARRYVEEITESKAEEKALRESIKTAKEDKDVGKLDVEAYKQYVNATEEAIRQNKIDRAEAYSSIAAEFGGMLGESAKRAQEWRKAEQERINDIHHNCNSDMEGRVTDEHHKDNKVQKLMNNDIVRFFLAPLGTFDQMLRMFGKKNVNGEGYLWNRFMRSWVDATENEYTGYRDDLKELDTKVSEVYGKKMKWADLFTLERKMGKVPVEFWDGGERKLHELTQGNLLYIYMVDKMSDGRMKLRYMGITEQDVQHITEILDPKFKELADWLQEEYLVNKRNKYNEVHKRMFGAPMAAIDNYFPLKILKNALDKEEDVAEDDNAGIVLPGTTTNGIIKRTRNNKPLDVTGADAFNVIADHLQEMEHWAAFAELTRDINTMLSYKRFRNQVMNMSSAYGAGAVLWKNFRSVCKMAVGAYRPPSVALDKSAVNIAKGVTAAKVSFRVFTALKQFLSFPAYLPDSNPVYLAQSVVNPAAAWKWSMSNLPIFEKRWKSRMAGDPRLMKSDMDWKAWRSRIVEIASMIGMSPNAFVDALTVSMGAYAMYKTRYDKYKRWGFDEETADKHAKQDATILYNSTQQSSEGAFLSTMQVDRSWFTVLLSIFRNSSMSYERQEYDAFRNEVKLFTPGYRQRAEEFMIKQLQREGLTEEQAKKAARSELRKGPLHNLARIFVFGFAIQAIWNLGAYLPYLILGDDDDEKSKMTDDALTHALFGSLEGLTSGDVLSQAGNMALQGEGNWATVTKDMPLVSDLSDILKTFPKDNVEALNDCINLLTQSAVGVNPQSITDAMVAIMDYCGDDAQTSRECALLMARILNCPQSQLDKIYFDELSASGVEASKMTPSQIAERFARYKRHRSAPLTGWMYNDAAIADKDGKRKETVYKKARENFKAAASKSNKEELEQWKAEYKETAAKLSAIKKLREQDEDEADEQMDELENTPEYDRYLIMKDYNSDMNDITKAWLNSKSPTEREQLTKAMFKVQQEMVNELKTSK